MGWWIYIFSASHSNRTSFVLPNLSFQQISSGWALNNSFTKTKKIPSILTVTFTVPELYGAAPNLSPYLTTLYKDRPSLLILESPQSGRSEIFPGRDFFRDLGTSSPSK